MVLGETIVVDADVFIAEGDASEVVLATAAFRFVLVIVAVLGLVAVASEVVLATAFRLILVLVPVASEVALATAVFRFVLLCLPVFDAVTFSLRARSCRFASFKEEILTIFFVLDQIRRVHVV